MAIYPLQSQPVNKLGEIVGYIEGAAVGDNDGDRDNDDPAAVGEEGVEADEEVEVGFDGQFTIPNLNAQRAFASVCCWVDPVEIALGDTMSL